MPEPPKMKPEANGLLGRLAGKRKLKQPIESLPVEQEERYSRWWEMRLLGASIPEIIKHEKKQGHDFTQRQVIHGLDLYSQVCMDEAGKVRRMAQHRAFVDKLRQIAMGQVQNLRKEFVDSGGLGIPVVSEETSFDAMKNEVASKKKITYEQIDRSMIPWLRFAVDLDKYAATIDGLLGDLDNQTDLNSIDVNIDGFIGMESDDDGA